MIYLSYAILVAVLVGVMAWAKGDGLHSPVGLTVISWLLVFVAGLFFRADFYAFGEKNLILWLCWFLVSCTGYLLCSGSGRQKPSLTLRRLPFDYSALLVVLILFLIYKIWQVGQSGPLDFAFNLRLASTGGAEAGDTLAWAGMPYPVILALFIFETLYASPRNRRVRLLLWVWMLLYAVGTMSKFGIFTPVVAWGIVKLAKEELPIRKLVMLGGGTLSLMLTLHLVRGNETGLTLLQLLGIYVYAPIIALGQLHPTKFPPSFGEHTLRFAYAIKYALVGGAKPVDTILGWVDTPMPANVYTVVQPFYQDFGLIGILAAAALYGVVFGGLFKYARRGNAVAIMLYAGLASSLTSQVFAETLVMNLSGNLKYGLASLAILFLSRRQTFGVAQVAT